MNTTKAERVLITASLGAMALACHLAVGGFEGYKLALFDTANADFQEYAALGICEDTEGCYLDLDDIKRVIELSERYPHFYDEYKRLSDD